MDNRNRGVNWMFHGSSSKAGQKRPFPETSTNFRSSSSIQHVAHWLDGPSTSAGNFIHTGAADYGGTYNPPRPQPNSHQSIKNKRRRQDRNNNHANESQPMRRNKFYFKRFQAIVKDPPEKILLHLIARKDDLVEFLKTKLTPDTIVLLVHVFANAATSSYSTNLGQLMTLVAKEKHFNDQLLKFILRIPFQNERDRMWNSFFWNKTDEFWDNLGKLWQVMADMIPMTAREVLPKLLESTTITLAVFEKKGRSVSDVARKCYESLQIKIAKIEEEIVVKQSKRGHSDYAEEPPDDFREISIYPQPYELHEDYKPFLRENKIGGGYRDVHQYLDVQFRLLREDFVSPLRRGIHQYLHPNNKNNRLSNVKVYHNVQCIGIEKTQSQMGFEMCVTKTPIRNVEHTKRFMFGALVCFTTNNFKTILFGKIIDRRIQLLRKGCVVVGFEDDTRLESMVKYTMLECTVYFEPYYQVLGALQRINMNVFPLRKYLIDVSGEQELPDYVKEVGYLRVVSEMENQLADDIEFAYDMEDDYDMETDWPYHNMRVDKDHWLPYGINAVWPSHTQPKLNPSQLAAYKYALNSKFSIIQGPPGTGKTYLGLKIAHTLLRNKRNWKRGPMLVICYTNHALDQFLEGMLPQTNKVVRVGGQSKNKELDRYNIKRMRFYGDSSGDLHHLKVETARAGRLLQKCSTILRAVDNYNCVIKFGEFADVVQGYDESSLKFSSDREILNWLLQESNVDQDDPYDQVNQVLGQMEIKAKKEDGEIDEFEDVLNGNNKEQRVDLDDAIHEIVEDSGFQLTSLQKMQELLLNMRAKLKSMEHQNSKQFVNLRTLYEKVSANERYVQMKLRELSTYNTSVPPKNINLQEMHKIAYADRWRLYGHWLYLYKQYMITKLNDLDVEYRRTYRQYSEGRDMVDMEVMRTMDVIGMTTTGAAKLQSSLQALKCPIVIVEEAAEVLESHIITALSSGCQQLILIGDHKQLRPSTADYNMDKYFNLGISLFERMIVNKMPCSTLNVQHRMRPEISKLIVPTIYPNLTDHESVEKYPNIVGVHKNVFFITHTHEETQAGENSKENEHEALFLLLLARHLVLNGKKPEEITMLTPYSGQYFLMAHERKRYPLLDDMKITILDNYQGEENDVILLSLVRCNQEGKIGFLMFENRVCVALSRAKHGLYIMGNMDQLCNVKNTVWPQIRTVLTDMESLGTALPLRCKNHPTQLTRIQEVEDFKQVPEGGCPQMCNAFMDCGHNCTSICHVHDHKQIKCRQPCQKILCEFDHVCPKKCYEECEKCMVPKKSQLPCGHTAEIPCFMNPTDVICAIIVDCKLPCDHEIEKPCHADPENCLCPHPCDSRIEPCGHACNRTCHIRSDPDHLEYKCMKNCERPKKNCTTPNDPTHTCKKRCFDECMTCNIQIKKQRSICPHTFTVSCSENVDKIVCVKPCQKMLECGHPCPKKCSEECGGCQVKVEKSIPECRHKIKIKCLDPPLRSKCNRRCNKQLTCGHGCSLKCNVDCKTCRCKVLVTNDNITTPCGHKLRTLCHQRNATAVMSNDLLANCDKKCNKKLICGHMCSGTCGECAQGRIHKTCAEKCSKVLVCGHECSVPCREQCQPCPKPCSYKCAHSKCNKKCGVPCTDCKEPCTRKCRHQQCSALCSDICTVPPCEVPCRKILKCKHRCIGFCGDPCPPFCRKCDYQTVTEIFLGNEDEPDARFVYLQECKHIIESVGMDMYLEKTRKSVQISVIYCPRCKRQIISNQRYSDYIKSSFRDVQIVKRKHFGDTVVNATKQNELLREVQALRLRPITFGQINIGVILDSFASNLMPVDQHDYRQSVDKQSLVTFESRLEIIQQILDITNTNTFYNRKLKLKIDSHVDFLLEFMMKQTMSISNQEAADYNLELKRLNRIIQLSAIMNICSYESIREYKPCEELAFGFLPYSDAMDTMLKERLQVFNEASKTGLIITEHERKEIVAAVGLTQGHWFKCRNGHPYVIGECGGVMQRSICTECDAPIGGRQHAFHPSNAVATEMDSTTAIRGAYTGAISFENL